MSSLYEHLADWRRGQFHKHDLGRPGQDADEYAAEQIDSLSNSEFLRELSEALDALLEEHNHD